MTHWLALAATIVLTVLANVLLKHSAESTSNAVTTAQAELSVVRSALTPLKIAALGTYATAFLVYGYALKTIAVSVAYPVMASVSLITLALVGLLIFDEPFPPSKVLGTVLVVAGVVLLTRV